MKARRKIVGVVVALLLAGCAATQAAVDVAVTVAGDVCKFLSQDDPTAPQWVTVACSIEGAAGPVVVTLPWAAWTSAQGQTSAEAKARAAAHVNAFATPSGGWGAEGPRP